MQKTPNAVGLNIYEVLSDQGVIQISLKAKQKDLKLILN